MTRWLTTLFAYTTAFVGAGLLATACDPTYPVTSFRCNPSAADCPTDKYGTGDYVCCSDDPAALGLGDPGAPALPGYNGKSGGTPLFSGPTNHFSTSGFCIDTAQVPASAAITDPGTGQGCPLPCNPTWAKADVTAICGAGTVCCQTQELGELDCALDMELGNNGCYRPVTGNDISIFSSGLAVSDWSAADHDTHQGPAGKGCRDFVAAVSGGDKDTDDERLRECFKRLSVADQRGFCQAGVCPLTNPAYVDACERKNAAEGRTGC